MSLLTILKYPDPRLRKKSTSVEKVTGTIQDLAKKMFETMYAGHGIGLAAPQVGEHLRLIVVDVPQERITPPPSPLPQGEGAGGGGETTRDPIALVNPEMIEGSGLIQYEEGCLSCPELVVLVDRKAKIRVHYLDLGGKPLELDAEGLKAVCIQHEIDHLNGILLVDKLSRLKRDLYKQKQLKIAKEEKELAAIL